MRPEIWRNLAELGLLSIALDEENGGLGDCPFEISIVMHEVGRAGATEPFLPHAVLCGTALRILREVQGDLDPRVTEEFSNGIPFAIADRQLSGSRLSHVRATKASATQWRLSGAQYFVLGGAFAARAIVSAQYEDDEGQIDIGLFLIDTRAAGITKTARSVLRSYDAADLVFESAPAALLAGHSLAVDALAAVRRAGIAAACAAAVGAMETVLENTVEHLKTRTQFNRKIAEFQSLQHAAVDMLVALEEGRSMALLAAAATQSNYSGDAEADLSMAKAVVSRNATFVGEKGVQLHGAMGVMDESAMGQAFNRLVVVSQLFGGAERHLDLLAGNLERRFGLSGAAS
jgi:alkylation response protein AidB-like acyl-CoA dehydrogenase